MRIRAVALAIALGIASTGWAVWRTDTRFPHEKHAKLFVSCESCHSGIVTGAVEKTYPDVGSCASCHNGTDAKTIGWRGAARVPSNLRFSHLEHVKKSAKAGDKLTCLSCHSADHDATRPARFMVVERAEPSKCISCHEHKAPPPEHLAESNVCSTCHVTLAKAAELPDSAIAAFPKPRSHAGATFLSSHGKEPGFNPSSCSTCHARESCARCHPNADRLPSITALEKDARVARLTSGKRPAYATPDDHLRADWGTAHASNARKAIESCANCHAQGSCQACHQGEVVTRTIGALPIGGKVNGPGVQLAVARVRLLDRSTRPTDPAVEIRLSSTNDSAPPRIIRIHPAGFGTGHSNAASSERTTCNGCHQERFCESCHEGTSGARRFHTPAYMSKHAADAYGQEKNCSSCHNTESFCRSCHVKSGLDANGNGGVAAHTGQPAWLLQHGEAARQGLAGCTSCHQQRDCLRCHSTLSWKVNPHGANFDARRVSSRNKQMCLTCHIGDPLKQ